MRPAHCEEGNPEAILPPQCAYIYLSRHITERGRFQLRLYHDVSNISIKSTMISRKIKRPLSILQSQSMVSRKLESSMLQSTPRKCAARNNSCGVQAIQSCAAGCGISAFITSSGCGNGKSQVASYNRRALICIRADTSMQRLSPPRSKDNFILQGCILRNKQFPPRFYISLLCGGLRGVLWGQCQKSLLRKICAIWYKVHGSLRAIHYSQSWTSILISCCYLEVNTCKFSYVSDLLVRPSFRVRMRSNCVYNHQRTFTSRVDRDASWDQLSRVKFPILECISFLLQCSEFQLAMTI